MLKTLARRVTSQIATRFRLWRQEVSYPVILQSMVTRKRFSAESYLYFLKFKFIWNLYLIIQEAYTYKRNFLVCQIEIFGINRGRCSYHTLGILIPFKCPVFTLRMHMYRMHIKINISIAQIYMWIWLQCVYGKWGHIEDTNQSHCRTKIEKINKRRISQSALGQKK